MGVVRTPRGRVHHHEARAMNGPQFPPARDNRIQRIRRLKKNPMPTETARQLDTEVTRQVGPTTHLDHVMYQVCQWHGCNVMEVLDDETSTFAVRAEVATTLMKVRAVCSEYLQGLHTMSEVDAAWAAAEEAIDDWADNSAHP